MLMTISVGSENLCKTSVVSDFYQLKTIRPLDPTCEPLNYRTIAENLNDRQAFSSGIEFGAANQ